MSSRGKYSQVHNEWNKSLDLADLSDKEKGRQCSENYKAHKGKTVSELRAEYNDDNVLDHFTEEELQRHTRLEQKQVDKLEGVYNSEDAKEELREVRKNKNWWW